MSLNLFGILQDVLSEKRGTLNESVSPSDVIDSINKKVIVKIHYDDGEHHKTGTRFIEPFAYGLSKAGNDVLRAFQVESGPNGTLRGTPKWKLFRLDRVTSWAPTKTQFELTPDEAGWANAYYFNKNGDKSMSQVLAVADMGEHSELDIQRAKTRMLKTGRAFSDKRTEGGLPSGFRKRKVARRGKIKQNLDRNLGNPNNGPVVSADDKFKDYELAMRELGQNQSGPVMKNTEDTLGKSKENDAEMMDLKKKYPEYFSDNED